MLTLRTTALITLLFLTSSLNAGDPAGKIISVQDYRDKVYASWLGQITGNIYGLSYEFQFLDDPGPDVFPYGFGDSLNRVREHNGAFSDDDTDIEYMYLLQMESHGWEPTYRQLAEAWKYHVRDRVWVANRSAVTLMHAGYSPPATGSKDFNPNWFQIDPQLVNEIWAVTAPGMVEYATQKSAWAAKITNDDFGIEPTVHYAAMYAAAFFEKDINRLINIGTAALPNNSRFAQAVEHMKKLYRRYPSDWQAARRELAEHYYGEFDYNRGAWPAVDAILNGAAGILALLYGQGDFQRTLDMASGLGFDADNQAATMSGLLGIVHGSAGIPEELLFPLGRDKWDEPFNDVYVNVSRHDLPDASIRDMARRTALQGEKIILANGGRIVTRDGVDYYEINPGATFTPPMELVSAPQLVTEIGRDFSFRYIYGETDDSYTQELASGALPGGLELEENRIVGTPTETGKFEFRIRVNRGSETREQAFTLKVHGKNLAQDATGIISNESITADDLELIRDGESRNASYYNRAANGEPRINWYGYTWEKAQLISTLVFNPGLPEEWGGWYTSLEVEFLDPEGEWQPAEQLSIEPPINFDNTQWLKGAYIEHSIRIEPVLTTAIRIIGHAGGIEQDERNGGERRYYTAISELAVYPD
jgi:hypothetical protein